VIKPNKVGSVVKYTVQGHDSHGAFEVVRRFNEFLALRNSLVERWPGCYIPCIPEKKTLAVDTSGSNMSDWSVGSTKEGAFVEMRRALFERFIREIAKFEYIVESKEFQLFAHEGGEVDKHLKSLPTQTPTQILEKYRVHF
jgi:sorting nexin-1/2/sorting nexin-4